jgi:putative inorganic carbon (HCO3(-)) transporter
MAILSVVFLLVFFITILLSFATSGVSAIVGYQIIYFMNPMNRWWSNEIPDLPYSFITVLTLVIILLIKFKKLSEGSRWSDQIVIKLLLLLLVYYYIVYFFALLPDIHLQFTINFTTLIFTMLVFYKLIRTETALDIVLWGYIFGASYIGYVATITGRNSNNRVEGIGMVDGFQANDTASALVPAFSLLIYYAWQGNLKIKILSAILGAFIVNGIVLINSRGSFLGVIVSLSIFFMYMIFSKYQKEGQKFMAIFIILLGFSGGLIVADDSFWERMDTLSNPADKEKSGSSRTVFWMATFEMLELHPFGMGVSGYNVLSSQFIDQENMSGSTSKSVHSSWFQGLSEIGWLGMTIFLFLIYELFRQSWNTKKLVAENGDYSTYFKILALECSLIGFLVSATFINRFRAEILYWMIFFILISIKIYSSKFHSNIDEN